MNNTLTNVLLVIILIFLVGFGVWYFTMQDAEEPEGGIEIQVGGGENTSGY